MALFYHNGPMHVPKLFVSFLTFLFAAGLPAMACDVCAIYTSAEPRGEFRSGFFVSVAEQFTHFGTLQMEGSEVSNSIGQRLDSSITQSILGYGFNERFSLQVNVPFIHRAYKRPEGFATDEGTESGLGDVSLLGKFLAWQKETEDVTFFWNLLGGIKFPTGDSIRLKEEFSEVEVEGAPASGIHGHDLALGSGSFDCIVGTNFYLRYKRAFMTGAVQYAIRSRGDFDYRFANDLSWEAGCGLYLLLQDSYTLALQAVVSGEHKGTDTFRGLRAEDTGVTSVFVGPKIIATWKDRLSADIGVDLPANIENTALQAVPDYRIRAALTWRF